MPNVITVRRSLLGRSGSPSAPLRCTSQTFTSRQSNRSPSLTRCPATLRAGMSRRSHCWRRAPIEAASAPGLSFR
jgi:hypothetical protein